MSKLLNLLKNRRNKRNLQQAADNVYKVLNPYSWKTIEEIEFDSIDETVARIERAQKLSRILMETPLEERLEMVENILQDVQKEKNFIIEETVKSGGKPLKQVLVDFNSTMAHSREFINRFHELKDHPERLEKLQPHGTSFIMTSWKNPIKKSMMFLLPSFLFGNMTVLKPSLETPLVGLRLERIFNENSYEDSVISLILKRENLPELMNRVNFDLFLYQGSHSAGISIHDQLKLGIDSEERWELDNHIIAVVNALDLNKENRLETAVKKVLKGAFNYSGQGSHPVKHVFVSSEHYEDFKAVLVKKTLELKVGNPLDEGIDLGPIYDRNEIVEGKKLIEEAVSRGAHLVMGGEALTDKDGKTKFFQPTIMEHLDSSMMLYYKTFTSINLPILVLNKFDSLGDFKEALLTPESRLGGKRYMDQVMLISDRKNDVDFMIRNFQCARIFHNSRIESDVFKEELIEFYSKELKIVR